MSNAHHVVATIQTAPACRAPGSPVTAPTRLYAHPAGSRTLLPAVGAPAIQKRSACLHPGVASSLSTGAPTAAGRGGLGSDGTQVVSPVISIAEWQTVPGRVQVRLKEALNIKESIRNRLRTLTCAPGYGQVFWHPEDKTIWAALGDGDESHVHARWYSSLKSIPGVLHVRTEAEAFPPNREDWVLIKRASILNAPYEAAGLLTGGPTPLTNAVVNALAGGGVGYLGGTLLDQIMPEDFIEQGAWRKRLALLGAGLGTIKPLAEATANNHLATAAGRPLGLASLITPQSAVPLTEDSLADMHNFKHSHDLHALRLVAAVVGPDIPPLLKQAAGDYYAGFDASLRPVPVDAFNQAIWNDVHNGAASARANPYGTKSPWGDDTQSLYTPPAVGAAASGLVSGVQQMYGGAGLLSPRHFIAGLAAAGTDAATAKVAGGILGVLGGLRPAAQQQLQQMGVWSGLIRGVTGSVLGLY